MFEDSEGLQLIGGGTEEYKEAAARENMSGTA
jgi:hypothetical protein